MLLFTSRQQTAAVRSPAALHHDRIAATQWSVPSSPIKIRPSARKTEKRTYKDVFENQLPDGTSVSIPVTEEPRVRIVR